MNKLKELIIQALDDGELTSLKDMKWPSLRISKWLFISTAFLSPLLACILASTFMDLESREFIILLIPLLFNWGVYLCWLLYKLLSMLQISRKKMMVYTICTVILAVTISAVNMMYIKRKPVNPELEYWNRFSTCSDQELLKEYLAFMDNDTIKVCRALVMPKQTLKRLIDGTSTATRYGSTNIRHIFILSHLSPCYGKEFILSDRKHSDKFLFDSLSKHLNPLWEKEKK